MKVLVLGANGMLGHKLVQVLGRKCNVFGTVRGTGSELHKTGICRRDQVIEAVDVLDTELLTGMLRNLRPDVVVNAVGVIKHREEANDAILSIETNALLPHRLAEIAEELCFRIMTFSTDCVFRGDIGGYTESDYPDAADLYGKTKHLGELNKKGALTLRSSIVGRELSGARSLVEWVISQAGKTVNGFAGARYSGFTTLEMSKIVEFLILEKPEMSGLYHVSSEPISKFDLIGLLNDALGLNINLRKEMEFVIDRTLNSDRFHKETGYLAPSWSEMISELAGESGNYRSWRKLRF